MNGQIKHPGKGKDHACGRLDACGQQEKLPHLGREREVQHAHEIGADRPGGLPTADIIDEYRNTGGFDIIGSGRTKLEKEEQFEKGYEISPGNFARAPD